jgi:Tol biopolymer transport system component
MQIALQTCRIKLTLNVIAFGLLLAYLTPAHADTEPSDGERAIPLIGYTEGRNDLEGGQFVNWRTNRACLVRPDGTGRKVIAEELTRKENAWTQFAGWSPDGQQAVILSLWESPKNAEWEREHKTFRMTEGWLVDTCLLDMATGTINNLTAVDRVSSYNTGLFFRPDGAGYGFTPLIDGVSKPFVMDRDGRNKRDVSGSGGGFAYGYSASPDGTRISYHENYQIHVSNADGSEKRKIETGKPFNFVPQWSPDGEWLMFVSGEHYNCHPHIVRKDGMGLRKLADRGGYRGVVERLKHPDFHSESSDVPVWAADGKSVYYTAKVGGSIELMRVSLDGTVEQLTKSQPGVRHYHPSSSPDGRWILFGSDRSGIMQLYVARADGSDARAVTNVPANSCAMHGHWQPVGGDRHSANPRNAQDNAKQAADDLIAITPRVVARNGVLGVEYHSSKLRTADRLYGVVADSPGYWDERDGFYIPPPLPGAPHSKGWKTYMDVLHYDDGDCPASNQGFHCGALMAAKELGLPVTDVDIDAAIAAYQRIFNTKLGFRPTSLKQQDVLGQDTLYGATLTYAVFGRKVLTDDSGNYLLAGVYGLAPEEVDARLIERIKLELVQHPKFNEDINTVSGQPHGNAPYADYSVYIWLRQQIRRSLNQSGPDPVGRAIDTQWRVVREDDMLRLKP